MGALLVYKFYLALENSNCPDYVAEKFWDSLSLYMAIPIVIKRYYKNYKVSGKEALQAKTFRFLTVLTSRLKTTKLLSPPVPEGDVANIVY